MAIVAAVDEQTAREAFVVDQGGTMKCLNQSLIWTVRSAHSSVVHPEMDFHCNFPIGAEPARNIASSHRNEFGDVEGELASCEVTLTESYRTQAQAHAMMETYRAFSYLDQAGRLVVVSSTQIPFHVRRQLARALQISATRIRVIKPRIGGGFGGKQTGVAEVYAAIVTWKTGKPAVIVYDRRETFIASNSRHATQFYRADRRRRRRNDPGRGYSGTFRYRRLWRACAPPFSW